jgi:kynurenine 3-monooxygenase
MQTHKKKIAVVGSGLVGSLLAIYLRKQDIQYIFDRSPDIRKIQFSGRSINLAMSNRGWKALDAVE